MTLAGALKESGYHTAHIGKWHLGAEPYSPLEHGFEHDWPHTFAAGPGGANGYFAPWSFAPDVPQKNGEHIEDRCAAEAVQWIRDHKEGPFFLNYWSFSAHGPWMAKPDDIRDFEKRVDPEDGQRNPVYAGMLRALDNAVGSLVRCLAELGIEKETLIVFTSDNGACSWLDAAAMKRFGFTSPPTDNRPLRSGKTSIYEGGTRVPAIIVWPGVIQGGGTASGFFQSTDVYPTILAMLDLPPPRGRIGGLNQVPALTGGEPVRDTVFCHWPHGAANNRPDGFEPSTSVRKGNFKLIRFHSANDDGSDRMELYDLSKDPGEKRNLSTKFPLKAEELGSLIDRYLIDTKAVIPKLNPTFHAP